MPSICECIRYQYTQSLENITTGFSCRKSVAPCERMKRITMGFLQALCIPVEGCSKKEKIADQHNIIPMSPRSKKQCDDLDIQFKSIQKDNKKNAVYFASGICLTVMALWLNNRSAYNNNALSIVLKGSLVGLVVLGGLTCFAYAKASVALQQIKRYQEGKLA